MRRIRVLSFGAAALFTLAMCGVANAQFWPQAAPPFSGGRINNGLTNNGGTSQIGSLSTTGIGQPVAPTINPITTGLTTATYYCVALDINGLGNLGGGTGNTIPSSGTTITNGAATPDTTVTCAGRTGALGFVVLKNDTAHALGDCLTLGSGNSCAVTDVGQALTSYTANTYDLSGGIALGLDPSASTSLIISFNGGVDKFQEFTNPFTWSIIRASDGHSLQMGDLLWINTESTVASLPACAANSYAVTWVTDATSCTAGSTPIGGGSTKCFVTCDGVSWKH